MSSKKIFSYVLPQSIVNGRTKLGQAFEVNMENGVKVLNSENANYSFGSLHQIMLKGIAEVLKKIRPANVLMLGLGAGSALSILANKCHTPYQVTVIEIDADLIEIARQHFELNKYTNVQIIGGDAAKVVKTLPAASFDLIIDDIFWDNTIPAFCLGKPYLQDNARLLQAGGIYMRNTMNMLPEDSMLFEQHLQEAFSSFYHVRHAEHNNRIYFCQR